MSKLDCPGIAETLEVFPNGGTNEELDGYCLSANKGMWYYDVFLKPGSGPTVYRSLLESAKRRIDVWDPYLHPSDARLFSNISSDVDLRILTCFGALESELRCFEFNDEYKGFVNNLKELQCRNQFGLKIAIINAMKCGEFGRGKLPHDRLLFVDKEAYLIGSSLEYHSKENQGDWLTSVKNTTIYKIADIENREILYNSFLRFWNEKHECHCKYVDVLVDQIGEDVT